jgi:hypothetical protein
MRSNLDNILKELIGEGNYIDIRFDRKSNTVWVYYAIYNPLLTEYAELSEVYGFYAEIEDIETKNKYRIIAINLIKPYNKKRKEYRIRELVGSILHELLHYLGIEEEELAGNLTKKLLERYRFSVIKPYK